MVILSNMESSDRLPTRDEAAAALADAESARAAWAQSLVVPPWTHAWLGAAVAFQLVTAAAGLGRGDRWAPVLMVGGVLVIAVVAFAQVARLRRLNGVRLDGYVNRVVFGTATRASLGYAVAMAVAYAAALRDWWWLVGLAAVAGGLAYAMSGRHWVASYRREPERLAGGEGAIWLAAVVAMAVGGLVLLVAGR